MRDQGLDLDHLAAPGVARDIDESARHSKVLHASRDGDDHIDAGGPERSVRELRDGDHLLGVGESDAGRDARLAGARREMKIGDVGLRVLLVEQEDGLDVVGGGGAAAVSPSTAPTAGLSLCWRWGGGNASPPPPAPGASPMPSRIPAAILAGVARAARTQTSGARTDPAATAPAPARNRRRVASSMVLRSSMALTWGTTLI